MKKILLPVIAASALLITACGEVTVTDLTDEITPTDVIVEPVVANYNVDAATSTLEWHGFDASAPENHYHKGTVGIVDGSITTTDAMITAGSVNIDMTAVGYTEGAGKEGPITSADSAAFNGLLGHISTEDIFNTMAMGSASFTVTSCDEAGITGTLNVLGTDVEVMVPGMPAMDGDAMTLTTDWFEVDIAAAVPFFTVPEGDEPAGMRLSMKLNLTANK